MIPTPISWVTPGNSEHQAGSKAEVPMTNATESAFLLRLDRLEREVRLWKRWVLVAAVLVGTAAVFLLPIHRVAATAEKVRAKEFIVVTDDGREVAALWAYGQMPTLTLSDHRGKPRLQADLLPDGSPRIYLADADQRIRLRLGAGSEGRSNVELINKEGQVIWKAP
jgi:hypothetical protein